MMKTEKRIRPTEFAKLLKTQGKHNDGGSLYLVVRGGSVLWEYQFKRDGHVKSEYLGSAVGPFPLSLKDARDKRDAVRHALRNGTADIPQVHHAAPVAAGELFPDTVTEWLIAECSDVAEKTRDGAKTALESLGFTGPTARITAPDVRHALQVIIDRKTKRSPNGCAPQAERIRQDLQRVFKRAIARRVRLDNPATLDALKAVEGIANYKLPERGEKHHARVSRDNMPSLYASIVDGNTARALRFLILTVARTEDVEGATWREIFPKRATFVNADGDDEKLICDAWIIPAERTKERKRRIVPLPPQAMAILNEKPGKPSDLLFGKLPANAMLNLLQKTHPNKTVHGMRSVFRDWAVRQPAVPLEHGADMRDLAELQQGHKLPKSSACERSYARDGLYDLRAPLMAKWAAFATGL
jgi:integrase